MASNYNRIITMYHVAIITESNDLSRSMKLDLLECDNTGDLLSRERRTATTGGNCGEHWVCIQVEKLLNVGLSQESVHRRAHVLYRSPP